MKLSNQELSRYKEVSIERKRERANSDILVVSKAWHQYKMKSKEGRKWNPLSQDARSVAHPKGIGRRTVEKDLERISTNNECWHVGLVCALYPTKR